MLLVFNRTLVARLFEHLQRTKQNLPEILQNISNKLEKIKTKNDFDKLKTKEHITRKERFPLKLTTEIEEGAENGLLKIETYTGRSTWIISIKHVLESTRKILHSHKWSIIKPAKGYYWPTSDNPVVKVNYYSPGNYDLKGGWGLKKGNIIFPLSPEHAMFVQIGDRPILRGTRLSVSLTKEIIKFIVENSHRKIFSHKDDISLTFLKARTIDSKKLERENNEIKLWHESNSKLEREYFASNRVP